MTMAVVGSDDTQVGKRTILPALQNRVGLQLRVAMLFNFRHHLFCARTLELDLCVPFNGNITSLVAVE